MIALKVINISLLRNSINFSLKLHKSMNSTNKPTNNFSSNDKTNDSSLKKISSQQQSLDAINQNKEIPKPDEDNDKNQIQQSKRNKYGSKQRVFKFEFFFALPEQQKVDLITQYKEKLMKKQLSILANEMVYIRQTSDLVWCSMENAFISFLKPTTDHEEIRIFARFLYALGKSKKVTQNYETYMAFLLPYSTHQSFTQIVTSISRMGGTSVEFTHIVQKLYWKRKQQFLPIETVLINYVLAKNGKKIDADLINILNSLNLKSITIMLRCYDRSNTITPQILKKCAPAILTRKLQTNVLDLSALINIYTKFMYLDDARMVNYFEENYSYLERNISLDNFADIWQYVPKALNANKYPVLFVQKLIKTYKKLKLTKQINERALKVFQMSFESIENLEIRVRLQKI